MLQVKVIPTGGLAELGDLNVYGDFFILSVMPSLVFATAQKVAHCDTLRAVLVCGVCNGLFIESKQKGFEVEVHKKAEVLQVELITALKEEKED